MKIVKVYIGQGELYEVMGEDSPLHVYDVFVCAVGEDGKHYAHQVRFKSWYEDDEGIVRIDHGYDLDAVRLMDRVDSQGVINLEFWDEIPDRPNYGLGEVDEVSLMDEEERFHRGL